MHFSHVVINCIETVRSLKIVTFPTKSQTLLIYYSHHIIFHIFQRHVYIVSHKIFFPALSPYYTTLGEHLC